MKVLIAEDDLDMIKILSLYLKKEGYEVHTATNGKEAINHLIEQQTDLMLLDWMMPEQDGIDVCREVRELHIPVKILMLTAKSENDHEFAGLSAGADDYLRKPFDVKVLLLRIKKLCQGERILRYKTLMLNQETMEVQNAGERLILTKTEFELLRYFMRNVGGVLSRNQLLDQVWGMDYEGDARTVDTHVRRLRVKLGDSIIKTHVGLGYIMEVTHE